MIDTKTLKVAAIGGIVAVAAIVGYAILGLVPNNVTETVKIITSDSSGCTVETSDKFVLKIGPCNAKPGETITATYDKKIKDRYQSIQTP